MIILNVFTPSVFVALTGAVASGVGRNVTAKERYAGVNNLAIFLATEDVDLLVNPKKKHGPNAAHLRQVRRCGHLPHCCCVRFTSNVESNYGFLRVR